MTTSKPYDIREFDARYRGAVGRRIVVMLIDGRYRKGDVERDLATNPPQWGGKDCEWRGAFNFWVSEKRGREHGYHAYEDEDGIWHVEARRERPTKPVKYDV